MRRTIALACLLMVPAEAAQAQNLDALTEALNALPAAVLAQPVPDQAYFVDVQALLGLAEQEGRPFERADLARLMPGATLRPVEALAAAGPEAWDAKSGVPLAEISWFAGFGTVPSTVTLWGVQDEAAATSLVGTLAGMGFAETATAGVIGNGEPLMADLQKRDPSDPWRSSVGAAAFAAATGKVVVEASTPEGVVGVTGPEARAGANPAVATLLAGLEQSVGDGWIVSAMLISPAFGLRGIDPAAVMLGAENPEAARKALEEQAAAQANGVPPYFSGIIADVQLETPALAIALSYPDCTLAQSAADAIAAKLQAMPEAEGAELTANAVEGAGGLCAATIVAAGGTGKPLVALLGGFIRGEAGPLQIGTKG